MLAMKSMRPTQRSAVYLLAASMALAVLAIVLAVVQARLSVIELSLGAALGLGVATCVMSLAVRHEGRHT